MEEALTKLLKEEPYAYSEDRLLIKRKLQLRYVRLLPETRQRFWRLQVHKWFIKNCRKNYPQRVIAIMNDAISRMHEGHRGKQLSIRRVNKLVKRIYKELAKIYGENTSYNLLYRMDNCLGMFLNMVTIEKTPISEITCMADNAEYDIWLHRFDWKYKREKEKSMINEHTGLCPDIAGIIASYI